MFTYKFSAFTCTFIFRQQGGHLFPVEGDVSRLCCHKIFQPPLLTTRAFLCEISELLPLCSHLCPYRVMAEEATDLPSGQDSSRVRVLVARHHLYSQRLQLGRIESSGRDGERKCGMSSWKRKVILITTLVIMQLSLSSVKTASLQNTIKSISASCNK